jgi:hypothetical protein
MAVIDQNYLSGYKLEADLTCATVASWQTSWRRLT